MSRSSRALLAVALVMVVDVIAACTQQAAEKTSAAGAPTRAVAVASPPPASLRAPSSSAPPATPAVNTTATPPATSGSPAAAAGPGTTPASPARSRYANARFGFSIDVPDGCSAQPPPEDGDGLSFTNTARTATVTGYGGNNVLSRSPSQEMAAVVTMYQSARDAIVYRFIKNDVIAVSGTTPHGTVFYQREVVYPAVICTLLWTYPAAAKAQYHALVTQTVDSFVPGPAHSG